MLNSNELEKIGNQLKELFPPLTITFHPSGEVSEFSTTLSDIAFILDRSAEDGVKLFKGDGSGLPATPALSFNLAESGTINYLAIPKGSEEPPFFEMLTFKTKNIINISEDLKQQTQALSQPIDIQIFITSTCPNCPNAVRAANTLTLLSKQITTTIIDVERFPKLGERFKVQSVPMIVINNELLINHVIPVATLAQKILMQNTNEYEKERFISLVNTSNFDLAAKRLLESDQEVKFFLSAWKKSDLSSRMGLMLLASQVLDENTDIFNSIVNQLIKILNSVDASLVGDTADLLGQIGHPDAIKPLKSLLQNENTDIVEIAEEALEALKKSV